MYFCKINFVFSGYFNAIVILFNVKKDLSAEQFEAVKHKKNS